jgi:tetratricopeptide (TPR) repeat protein
LQERLAHDLQQAVGRRAERAGGARQLATTNSEAYREYLQGRYHWNQRSEPALKKAIGHFEHAIALDPNFALAYAAAADAHTTLGYLGHRSPIATFPVARPYALKALQLDPSLAQAHAALAYIKFYFDWDWAGSEQEFRRALELNPQDPVAHQWYAVYLRAAGRADDAQREVQFAQQLDPLSLAINTDVGFHHYYAGRYPEAIEQLQAVLGMKKDFLIARVWLARSLLAQDRLKDALDETAQAEEAVREWSVLMAARGFTYALMGKREDALAVLGEMQQLSSRRFVTAYGVALVYTGLGENDHAFVWLQKAFDERSHWLVWLRLDPRWNSLRANPRFDLMVRRMNYPA